MRAVTKLTDSCIRKGYFPEEDRELYEYGFDIIIYTIWSTVVLLLLGTVLRQFWAAVIIVSIFYVFQSSGGGYHANSHLKCLLCMVVGLLAGLSFHFLNDRPVLLWSLLCLGCMLLLSCPLVLHPNKSYLEAERKRLTIRSIITTLSLLVIVISIRLWKTDVFKNELLFAFSAAFLLSGISRIIGKSYTKNRRRFLNKLDI